MQNMLVDGDLNEDPELIQDELKISESIKLLRQQLLEAENEQKAAKNISVPIEEVVLFRDGSVQTDKKMQQHTIHNSQFSIFDNKMPLPLSFNGKSLKDFETPTDKGKSTFQKALLSPQHSDFLT